MSAAVSAESPATGHRARLLHGMVEALRQTEYHELTVADIVRRARTSRRTFYEHFGDKDACFVALVRDHHERMIASIAAAVDPAAAWEAQVGAAVHAWIAACEAEPAVALSWIRVIPGMGQRGHDLARETMDAFVALVGTLTAQAPGVQPPSREMSLVLLGGLRELIASTVESGRPVSEVVDVATAAAVALLASGQGASAPD